MIPWVHLLFSAEIEIDIPTKNLHEVTFEIFKYSSPPKYWFKLFLEINFVKEIYLDIMDGKVKVVI